MAKEDKTRNVTYACLRCGHRWDDRYNPDGGPIELTCSECKSNSVRRLKGS